MGTGSSTKNPPLLSYCPFMELFRARGGGMAGHGDVALPQARSEPCLSLAGGHPGQVLYEGDTCLHINRAPLSHLV